MQQIKDVLDLISDEDVRNFANLVVMRTYADFIRQPASCGNHHSYEGGLLVHSCSTARLAGKIAEHFGPDKANRDFCIAGGLLHDIGKVLCYQKEKASDGTMKYGPTQESIWFHHIPIGFHLAASIAEGHRIPKEKYYPILHIILSHHGRLEYHSPVVPKIPEAFIVHKSDYLDAFIDASPEMRGIYNK
jgi:3'-5' exoribonuclease